MRWSGKGEGCEALFQGKRTPCSSLWVSVSTAAFSEVREWDVMGHGERWVWTGKSDFWITLVDVLGKFNFVLWKLGSHFHKRVIYLISILETAENGLEQGMVKFFCEEPNDIYFQICGSYSLPLTCYCSRKTARDRIFLWKWMDLAVFQ